MTMKLAKFRLKVLTIMGIASSPILSCFGKPAPEAEGLLYYSGLTDRGWQIHRFDLVTGNVSQLTDSIGDKRSPHIVRTSGDLLFRDANGRISRLDGGGERLLSETLPNCSSFFFLPTSQDIFFTRLATGNPQRQFIWKQKLGEDKFYLVYRPSNGSVRQIVLSSDGGWIVGTWLANMGEERIFKVKKDGSEFEFLTPPNRIAAYPAWSPDGKKVYFSYEVSKNNFDIWMVDTRSKELNPVYESKMESELAPALDDAGTFLYCEQRGDGLPAILRVSIENQSATKLALPHAAREPIWGVKR